MLRIPAVLSLAFVLAPLAAQEKHSLRYTFKPGHVCWIEQTMDMTQEMTVGENQMKMTQLTTTWLETTTGEVKDGVASVEQRYARIKGASEAMGQKSDYDSDVPGSKASGPLAGVAKMVGKTTKMRVDTTGKVLDVAADQETTKALEQMGSSLKEGTEMSVLVLPKDPIAVGETWTHEQRYPMGPAGEMKAKLTHKLVAVKGRVATVETSMEIDTSAVKIPGGVKLVADKSTGAFEVSLDDGLPISGHTEMVLRTSEDSPMQMKMTIRQATKQVPAPAKKEAPKEAAGGK